MDRGGHPISEIVSYGTFSEIGGSSGPPPSKIFVAKKNLKNGDWDFQIFGIKIDHFQGLNGPLEGQGGAAESKIVLKRGPKQALFG